MASDPARPPLRRRDGSAPTIVFLVTEDWYFWSHRVNLARAARDAGARVVVATRVGTLGDELRREGFDVVPLLWSRRNHDPLEEIHAFRAVRDLYRRLRPDIVHHVAIKPVVVGGLAARLAKQPAQVNAIAGLGYIETSRQLRARILRPVFNRVLRFAWKGDNVHAIVQNPEDETMLRSHFLPAARVHLVRGSGVDLARFTPSAEPPASDAVVATFVGRLLWSKGLGEIAEAARRLRSNGAKVRFRLVGDPDTENPESVPESTLRQWTAEGLVSWEHWSDDIPAVWRASHLAVLPSYREGLPKSLLEAAACARAIVATDVPGCREIARDGINALTVPPRDAQALADAVARLAADAELRSRYGAGGRDMVEREFSEGIVIAQTLNIYRQMLAAGAGA